MSFIVFRKRQLITFAVSVVLSVFLVALMTFGATFVDTDSVGIATSSPGGALGVKGVALVDDFLLANYVTATSSGSILQWGNGDATSTTYAVGVGGFGSVKGNWNVDASSTVSSLIATNTLSVGSSSPDSAQFAVVGDSVFGGRLGITDLIDVQGTATSTFDGGVDVRLNGGLSSAVGLTVTGGHIESSGKVVSTAAATSSFTGGVLFDTDSLVVDSSGSRVGIGTTTWPTVMGGGNVNSSETVYISTGPGTASTTLFLAGGASVGSAIILTSTDGQGCIAIMATVGSIDEAADATTPVLSVTSVPCPRAGAGE